MNCGLLVIIGIFFDDNCHLYIDENTNFVKGVVHSHCHKIMTYKGIKKGEIS
jgi:hypothetical protein